MPNRLFFESANKTTRWLAYKSRKERAKNIIHSLYTKEGEETHKQEEIQKIVRTFYTNLYKTSEISKEKIQKYLQEKEFVKFTEQKNLLAAPFTIMEIAEAIRHQKKGKAPGPDGIPAEFYLKKTEETITPFFKVLLDEIRFKNSIPPTWQEVVISIIPKQGLDHREIRNYRPISLINTDYKIFAIILASRLKRILVITIHQD